MILRCTNTALATDERELRVWLSNELGADDERSIAKLFQDHWPTNDLHYVEALKEIVTSIARFGKSAAHAYLEIARKPKEQREFEMEVTMWIGQHIGARLAVIAAYRGDETAKREECDRFLFEIEAYLQRMHPKHRATMKGAIATSTRYDAAATGREIQVDVPALSRTLFMADPLAATAAQSRLV